MRYLAYKIILGLLAFAFLKPIYAKEDKRSSRNNPSTPSGLIIDYRPVLNVNQVLGWIANDARLFQTSANNAAFFWPAGSDRSAIFIMSPWLACQYEGDESIGGLRTAAVQNIGRNGTEFQPGKIIQTAAGTLQSDDLSAQRNRLYVIRSGDDANSSIDYREWPFQDGAPYQTLENVAGLADSFAVSADEGATILPVAPEDIIPGQTPPIAIDRETALPIYPLPGEKTKEFLQRVENRLKPKLIGAVSAWCVYNDRLNRRFSNLPMNCEIQQYAFAFATSGEVGKALFFKFRVINRNIPNAAQPSIGLWKNTYFAIFNDNDLGDASDDLTGVDTLRALAYTYNATNLDPIYGAAPPAVGVDYFQGPFRRKNVAFTGNPRPVELDSQLTITLPDGAVIPNPRLNQPATFGASAHVRFDNAGGPIGDPETGRADQVYNFLRGRDKNGDPLGSSEPGSNFMFPGDPESGQGIIETQAADKRQLIVTGPFDVYAGEEQTIVVGVHIAQGTNNLNSVTRLKQENFAIQAIFNANFKVPQPPAPKVTFTSLSNQIILNWVDTNSLAQTFTKTIENVPLERPGALLPNDKYFFQGYNVYQFELIEGRSVSTSRVRKIATFDVIDNITDVLDFDPRRNDALGRPLVDITQTGTNTGIQRNLNIVDDQIRGGRLINGRSYYYAVTSYYVNPYLLTLNPYPNPITGFPDRTNPAALESLERIFEVKPQSPLLGTVLPNVVGGGINTDRLNNLGDDNVKITVSDPTKLLNKKYKVTIKNTQGTLWEIRDKENNNLLYPTEVDPVDSLNVFRFTNNNQYNIDSISIVESRADVALLSGMNVIVKQNLLGVKRDGQSGSAPITYLPSANKFFGPKENSYATEQAGASANTLQSSATNFNTNGLSDGGSVCSPAVGFLGSTSGTNFPQDSLFPVTLVFEDPQTYLTDANAGQLGYRYVINIRSVGTGANAFLGAADESFKEFIDTTTNPLFPGGPSVSKASRLSVNGPYQDRRKIPFKAYETDKNGQIVRQLNVLFTERNELKALGFDVNGQWEPSTATHGGQELLFITSSTYSENDIRNYIAGNAAGSQPRFIVNQTNALDIAYALWIRKLPGRNYTKGDTLKILPNYKISPDLTYEFETEAPKFNDRATGEKNLARINVFPNPYLASSGNERALRQTIVTFNNLPEKCKIRIFTLNGDLVRTISRENPNTPFEQWNLRNNANIPVASGMYLVHIETDFGNKILKLGVIMRQEREDFF